MPPYYVKWRDKYGAMAAPQMRFTALRQAIEFASAALSTETTDIWVEDDKGWPVADMQRIARYPRTKGPISRS